MKSLAIIPARFASVRFPGKLLALLGEKPVLQWVWENTKKATLIDEVIIATDDEKIFQAANSWGAKVEMTKTTHISGTDRCAEVAERHADFEIIINVQGDEPFLNPIYIDQLVEYLRSGINASFIATLCFRIETYGDIVDPNVVKVVKSGTRAQYFSRAAVPYFRGGEKEEMYQGELENQYIAQGYFQHIGVYGFKTKTLLELCTLPEGDWEKRERLEQLRWLENGYAIGVLEIEEKSIGIDTEEDLKRAEKEFGIQQ